MNKKLKMKENRNYLSSKEIELLNHRIQQEELSSRIYEQLALWMENEGYLNSAELFNRYAVEELGHAKWSKQYLLNLGVTPELKLIPSPEIQIECLCDAFEAALEHELDITSQCEDLASEAMKSGNNALYALASKYCAEQVEEIGKALNLVDISKLSTDMLIVDNYIGSKLL